MMRKRVLIVLGCLMALTLAAQEKNMARLVLEDTSYVDVSLGMAGQRGDLKDIYDPSSTLGGALSASARHKLSSVSLYGRFGYGYDYGWGSTWRGWIHPYETPFMLADSIPGTLSLEQYSMQAGAGVPLGRQWSLGIDVAYDVALMAKHKDLRNKNTAMVFRISPGLYWRGAHAGVGLNLGYERATERVEYMQVSESVEHVLFDLYGLWLYHASGFASAENRRMKENNRFFGNFQLDLSLGSVQLSNDLGLSWLQSEQTEVGYNNQQFGTIRNWTWSDDLSVKIGEAHEIKAKAQFSTMQGFRPLQRQELDPDSRIRVWVTYGDPVYCYWRQQHGESLSYTYGTSWKISVGVSNWHYQHAYVEYPQRFSQRIGTITPSVAAEIPLGRLFTLAASAGYAKDYDPYCDQTEWQLIEPLYRQWEYWEGNSWLAGIGLNWHSSSGRTYVRARYDLEVSTEPPTDIGGSRHTASLTLGFRF